MGIGIGHVRCHVTCLGASEDYTSQCDLKSSKVQHMILKTFRDKGNQQLSQLMQVKIQGVFQEAAYVQESSNNSLYCTNRTSLENLF